jgi:hypothetical protein
MALLPSPPDSAMKVQHGGHMQSIENKRLEKAVRDDISGSAEFSGIQKGRPATPLG